MTNITITDRCFQFSLKIVKLCFKLEQQGNGIFILGNQLLRSGTSISANCEEAQAGQSKADFIAKLFIALKEARETALWLQLLKASDAVEKEVCDPLLAEVEEIKRILGAIIIRTKENEMHRLK